MTARQPFAVLVYHAVRRDPVAGHEPWTVDPALFEEHVRAIAGSGRTSLTVSELAEAMAGRRVWPERPVVVTFDDGWADTLPAAELLAAHGLRSTVYVTSGLLGRDGMLDAAGLRTLAEVPGTEVGAHSVRHVRLDEISRSEAAWQIAESRAQVSEQAGCGVRSFAYPHGAHDAGVRSAVIEAGYSSAAAVKNALSHRGDDPFAISRLFVMADMPAAHVEALMDGRTARVAPPRERVRTRAFRAVRRVRRRLGVPLPESFAD